MGVQVKVAVLETAEHILLCSDVHQQHFPLFNSTGKGESCGKTFNMVEYRKWGWKYCSLVENQSCGCLNNKMETSANSVFI